MSQWMVLQEVIMGYVGQVNLLFYNLTSFIIHIFLSTESTLLYSFHNVRINCCIIIYFVFYHIISNRSTVIVAFS